MHWVVEKVMELDPVMAETAVVQKLNRVVASCCVAHMTWSKEKKHKCRTSRGQGVMTSWETYAVNSSR